MDFETLVFTKKRAADVDCSILPAYLPEYKAHKSCDCEKKHDQNFARTYNEAIAVMHFVLVYLDILLNPQTTKTISVKATEESVWLVDKPMIKSPMCATTHFSALNDDCYEIGHELYEVENLGDKISDLMFKTLRVFFHQQGEEVEWNKGGFFEFQSVFTRKSIEFSLTLPLRLALDFPIYTFGTFLESYLYMNNTNISIGGFFTRNEAIHKVSDSDSSPVDLPPLTRLLQKRLRI